MAKIKMRNPTESLNLTDAFNITTIGGVKGDVVAIKENSLVIETGADCVRVEFANFAVSSNNTRKKEAAKKKAAAAAARREAKNKKK